MKKLFFVIGIMVTSITADAANYTTLTLPTLHTDIRTCDLPRKNSLPRVT